MNYEEKLRLGYAEALTQLRQHPNIIWTRNNFFLLIQSGLLAFTLNLENRADTDTRLTACIAGLFLAFAWLWVNWAGRRLQRQWRKIVREFEEQLFDKEDGEQKVVGPFQRASVTEAKQHSASITLVLVLLSTGFIALWIVLLVRIYP